MKQIFDFPPHALAVIDPWLNKNSELYIKDKPSESYIARYKHNRDNSPFFFELKEYKITNGELHFLIRYSPGSKLDIGIAQNWANNSSAEGSFTSWLRELGAYDKYRNPHQEEDPILKYYQESIYEAFEFVDDDNDDLPFDYQTQLRLDTVLEHIDAKIDQLPDEEKTEQILQVKSDIKLLRATQTKLSRKQVRQKFAHILAKFQKEGLTMLKEFFNEAKKTIYKRILSGDIVEDINKLLTAAPN